MGHLKGVAGIETGGRIEKHPLEKVFIHQPHRLAVKNTIMMNKFF
jgi:hypothetical protein